MINFKVDVESLKRELNRDLKRISAKIPQAIARGLNEGGNKVRTQVQHALQRQTGLVKYKSVTSRVQTISASPSKLNYQIIAMGRPAIPIKEFRVKLGPHGVVAFPWAKEHDFKRSFVGNGRVSGAFMARKGKERFPVRRLFGPSLAKELDKDESAEAFNSGASAFVPPAIEKHLDKLLG
ncbi:MAG TPA: hypothetical protein VIF88_12095 [Methylocystis sp.]|jgi:hypothetical protein